MSAVVLDTSALLFWTLAPEHLSSAARRAISQAGTSGVLVSAISIWEIGLKVQRGTLSLGVPFTDYVTRLERVDAVTLVPVDLAIWMRVLELPWQHRDPADRVIVATADLRELPLVSSDAEIGRYYSATVWN